MEEEMSLRIGISLSGGGARGFAHVGVLQALIENGIEPTVIAGTSAGSIVGALYASGLNPEEMLEFLKNSKTFRLMKFGIPSGGFAKLTYLKDRLAEAIEEDDFSALEKPLFIAVSNLNTGELEFIDEGPLFDVVVASCSIPLVFQPKDINGQVYVDGGLLCNLPVTPLLPHADYFVGVNVFPQTRADSKSVNGVIGVAYRCFDLSIQANSRPQAAICDWLIEPTGVTDYHIFQFNKFQEIYEHGYRAGLEQVHALQDSIQQRREELLKEVKPS